MAFDINTAKPVQGGFDISTAKPVPKAEQSKYRKLFGVLPIPVPRVLDKPMEMAESGVNQLVGMLPETPEPTGHLVRDVAMGAPSILTKSYLQALGKVGSSFLSPESVATAGVSGAISKAAPLLKGPLRMLGTQGEEASGLVYKAPGALEEAYKDPKLILSGLFSKGKKAASALYEAGKKAASQPLSAEAVAEMKAISKPAEYVERAREYAQQGKLGEAEALEARKSIDSIRKTLRTDYFKETKDMFDRIVKESNPLAQADAMHRRAVQGENLRKLFPLNKSPGGGTSPFRVFTGLEMAKNPLGKLIAAPMLSPAIQGAAATTAGIVGRTAAPILEATQTIPGAAAVNAIGNTLASMLWKRKQAREQGGQSGMAR